MKLRATLICGLFLITALILTSCAEKKVKPTKQQVGHVCVTKEDMAERILEGADEQKIRQLCNARTRKKSIVFTGQDLNAENTAGKVYQISLCSSEEMAAYVLKSLSQKGIREKCSIQKASRVAASLSPYDASVRFYASNQPIQPAIAGDELILPYGRYQVSVEHPKYKTISFPFNANQTTERFSVNLVKKAGTLKINTSRKGMKVYVNDEYKGASPLSISLPWGSYAVHALGGVYATEKKEVELEPEGSQTLNLKARKMAKVKFQVNVKGAEVWVDGVMKGTTAQALILKPGRYRVEVKKEGYMPYEQRLDLTRGESRLAIKLKEGWQDFTTGMEFVWVKGGCFQMGDTFGDGVDNEKPVHEVCVDGFMIGKHEVTQSQWQRLMGRNPSHFKNCGGNCPVEKVSWNDVQEFIQKLNRQTGQRYRLPTEAEWEYAARSRGQREKYAGSSSLGSVAWYGSNSRRTTHPVGRKQPNGLGIFDMSGNVWEWTNDWYDKNYYSKSPRNNPMGPSGGSDRVFRGGGWFNFARDTRASDRGGSGPGNRGANLGFRLALPSHPR